MSEKKTKIIVVEDNAADREVIKEFFDSHGAIEFDFFEDGEDAHNQLNHNSGDIILLDINLPKVNGFEILKKIKSKKPRSSIVIVLTSSPNPEEIQIAYNLNANAYIVKPIDFDEFKNKLKIMSEFLVDVIEKPKK